MTLQSVTESGAALRRRAGLAGRWRGRMEVPAQQQEHYRALGAWLREQGFLHPPLLLSGVSEGAALAVLAASEPENHA